MSDETPVIFVVDDDASVRKALGRLFDAAGFRVEEFASAQEFLLRERPYELGCLVLDVCMPSMTGPALQEALQAAGMDIPIVFLTGHGDVPTTVRAMKAGAADFIEKPIRSKMLLDAVRKAVERHRAARQDGAELAEIRGRLDSLTPRERRVLAHLVAGSLNKQVAQRLEISESTVKKHRTQIMRKLGAATPTQLGLLVKHVELTEARHAPLSFGKATSGA
jgi:FixJ family two-component response regulator